jgi:IS4 transposase
VFVTNEHVTPERAMQLLPQYRHRWEIKNEYKTIKTHFLPKVASKDYRIRFLYFTLGCLLYNVWRLTNLVFREAVSVNLGETPPIPAGELVEVIGVPNDPGG